MRREQRYRWRLAATLVVLTCLSLLLRVDAVAGGARAEVGGQHDGRVQVNTFACAHDTGVK